MKAVTPFAKAIETLKPGATGSDMAQLLDLKADRTAALHWYAGRRQAPRWTLQLLAAKIRASTFAPLAIADEIEKVPERIGLSAGARNLAAYLARR